MSLPTVCFAAVFSLWLCGCATVRSQAHSLVSQMEARGYIADDERVTLTTKLGTMSEDEQVVWLTELMTSYERAERRCDGFLENVFKAWLSDQPTAGINKYLESTGLTPPTAGNVDTYFSEFKRELMPLWLRVANPDKKRSCSEVKSIQTQATACAGDIAEYKSLTSKYGVIGNLLHRIAIQSEGVCKTEGLAATRCSTLVEEIRKQLADKAIEQAKRLADEHRKLGCDPENGQKMIEAFVEQKAATEEVEKHKTKAEAATTAKQEQRALSAETRSSADSVQKTQSECASSDFTHENGAYTKRETFLSWMNSKRPCWLWFGARYGSIDESQTAAVCIFDGLVGRGLDAWKGCALSHYDAAQDDYSEFFSDGAGLRNAALLPKKRCSADTMKDLLAVFPELVQQPSMGGTEALLTFMSGRMLSRRYGLNGCTTQATFDYGGSEAGKRWFSTARKRICARPTNPALKVALACD